MAPRGGLAERNREALRAVAGDEAPTVGVPVLADGSGHYFIDGAWASTHSATSTRLRSMRRESGSRTASEASYRPKAPYRRHQREKGSTT